MSRDRLEEIKKHRNEADNSTDEYEFEKINFYNLHVDWLIEQAERVKKMETRLENVMDRHTYLEGDYYELQKQNKRYREALEFYAGGKHVAYKLDETDYDLVVDYGEKARQALGGDEK